MRRSATALAALCACAIGLLPAPSSAAPEPGAPALVGDPPPAGSTQLAFVHRMGDATYRYAHSLTHLAALGDGKLLGAAEDGSARIWDTGSGAEIARFSHGYDDVWDAIVLPDGRVVTAADEVRFWNPDTGELLDTWAHADDAFRVAAIPGTNHLASSHEDGVVLVRDLTSSDVIHQFAHPDDSDNVYSVVAPKTTRLITGDEDGMIILWDLTSGEEIGNLAVADDPYISTLSLSPDRKRVLASSGSELLCLECDDLSEVWRRQLGGSSLVSAWSPDGKHIAYASGKKLYSIDAVKGDPKWEVDVPHDDHRAVCFSEDGGAIFSGGDEMVYRFSAADGSLLFPAPASAFACGTDAPCAFSTGGDSVFSGGLGNAVFAFGRDTGEPLGVWKTDHPVEHLLPSPAGGLLAAAEAGEVSRFLPGGGKVDKRWNIPGFETIAASAGDMLVTGDEETASVWKNGAPMHALADGDAKINSVASSADGLRAATGFKGSGAIRIWNIGSGAILHKLSCGASSPDFIALSPDGRRVTLIDDEDIYTWQEPEVEALPAAQAAQVEGLVAKLSSDKFHIRELARIDLTAFGRGALPLLENSKPKSPEGRVQLAQVIQQLNALVDSALAPAHTFADDVRGFAIAPDNRHWAATIGLGNTTQLLFGRFGNPEEGSALEVLQTFDGLNSPRNLAFSPDGSHLLTGNRNTTLCLYRVVPAEK